MKIFISVMAVFSVLLTATACGNSTDEQRADMLNYLEETLSEAVSETSKTSEKSSDISKEENTEMKIKLEVSGSEFTVVLEENEAADAFAEMMKNEPVTIEMSDYSGFEKVGALGKIFPQTTVRPQQNRGISFFIREIKSLYFTAQIHGVTQGSVTLTTLRAGRKLWAAEM